MMNTVREWARIPPLAVYLQLNKMSLQDLLISLYHCDTAVSTEAQVLRQEIEGVMAFELNKKGFLSVEPDLLALNPKYNRNLVR